MKLIYVALLIFFTGVGLCVNAQTDSLSLHRGSPLTKAQHDSVYMVKLNYSGNLMIGGGVGLAGAGTFLIYEGVKTYNTPAAPQSTDPTADVDRNHRQGTAYIAGGAAAFAGSVVLVALGAKNKVEFKRRKKMMSLQSGVLDNGNLGLALTF